MVRCSLAVDQRVLRDRRTSAFSGDDGWFAAHEVGIPRSHVVDEFLFRTLFKNYILIDGG